jgi:hypothetical protein
VKQLLWRLSKTRAVLAQSVWAMFKIWTSASPGLATTSTYEVPPGGSRCKLRVIGFELTLFESKLTNGAA